MDEVRTHYLCSGGLVLMFGQFYDGTKGSRRPLASPNSVTFAMVRQVAGERSVRRHNGTTHEYINMVSWTARRYRYARLTPRRSRATPGIWSRRARGTGLFTS